MKNEDLIYSIIKKNLKLIYLSFQNNISSKMYFSFLVHPLVNLKFKVFYLPFLAEV